MPRVRLRLESDGQEEGLVNADEIRGGVNALEDEGHREAPAMIPMLHVHPSRAAMIRKPKQLEVEPWVPVSDYIDRFGN
jgi:hypothetical protein